MIRTAVASTLVVVSLGLAGCQFDDDNNDVVDTPNASKLNPVGTIQGVLTDSVTQQPIVGAVIDIGSKTATTNSRGVYIIKDVPATSDALNGTVEGSYSVTIDMRSVTSPVNMKGASSNPRYPDFSYDSATVNFTSLDDTSAENAGGGSGSNHDTPVDHLVANADFAVGKLAATISGIVAYSSGVPDMGLQPVGADWTVKLVSDGSDNDTTGAAEHVVGSATTDSSGKFSFANIESLQDFCIRSYNADMTYWGEECTNAPSDNETRMLTIQSGNAVFVGSTDDVAPRIISVTPENGADVAPGSVNVVFTFSEAIRQTPDTDTTPTASNGLSSYVEVNYLGAKAGNVAHSLAWNSTYTQLTVSIPTTVASSAYSVDLCDDTDLDLEDMSGQNVSNCGAMGSVGFTTNGSAAVSAPTITLVNSTSIDFGGVNPVLDWLPVSGAKSYRVYRAIDGGQYVLIDDTSASEYTDTGADFIKGNDEVTETNSYVVVAVNNDHVESAASNVVLAKDAVKPEFSLGSVGNTGANGEGVIVLEFNEPMSESSAETIANYVVTATGGLTISSAVYNVAGGQVTLTLSGALVDNTTDLTVTGVVDVGGNANNTTGGVNVLTDLVVPL